MSMIKNTRQGTQIGGALCRVMRDLCFPPAALSFSKTQLVTYSQSQQAIRPVRSEYHPYLFETKSTQKITCRTATLLDRNEIVDYLCQSFLTREPLMRVLGATDVDARQFVEHHVKEALRHDASFVAVDQSGKLCGIRLNAVGQASEDDSNIDFGSKMNTLVKFLEHVEGDLPKRLRTSRIMRHIAICVNPEIARSGVGTMMMEKSVKYAKDHGIRYMVATCSGNVATKLALKMGFRVVRQVPYDSYTDSESHFSYFPDDCLINQPSHRPFLDVAYEHYSAKLLLKNVS